MSVPIIPGYMDEPSDGHLGSFWAPPPLEFPPQLWPKGRLEMVRPDPDGWLLVVDHFFTETVHGGTGCVLVPADQLEAAIEGTSWVGHDLGDFGSWDSGRFDNGLVAMEGELQTEFFAQVRRPSGSPIPEVDISQSFLWFWDAYAVEGGWRYLNRAGREQDLIRYTRSEDAWRVEVRALELRSYLDVISRVAVVQIDLVVKAEHPAFEQVDDEFRNEWCHFDIHILHQESMGSRPAYSRLLGQYAVTGAATSRQPRWKERREDRDYPDFIYGVDNSSGLPLLHTCDPDVLGTYFDKDGTRLHYLTPIFFKREVLQPYAAEPARYSVSASRLTCLDLWGVSISFNSAGLVEVYLGDIGRDIPSDEWGHWRSYNVAPEGKMEEGRFRRDFLGQWASSKDPVADMKRAREAVNDEATKRFGRPLWRDLPGPLALEYRSMVGPLSSDIAALAAPMLLLTKVLVDSLDVATLKAQVEPAAGEQSLSLLRRMLSDIGDTEDCSKVLRDLQAFRSRGGVAHVQNSASAEAAANLGIAGLGPLEAFEQVIVTVTTCLNTMRELISPGAEQVGV